MKRIKVTATLFIMFSASLMNYRDHSLSSVNFFSGSEMVMCADSKTFAKNPAPVNQNCGAKELNSCTKPETVNPGAHQKMPSGKSYEANMIIM